MKSLRFFLHIMSRVNIVEECELCGDEGKTKKYTVEGESSYLCEDCGELVEGLEKLQKMFE